MSTRALIQKGQIKEGVKVTIKEGATLPYRAKGGWYGANYAKNDFQATVVRAYVTDTGEIAKGGNPYLQSMVVVVTGNGVEVEVECGVCYYSGIDRDGFVVLAQDEVAELEAKEAKEAKALVKRSGFTVEKDNSLEGQLKWEIRHDDYDLLDLLCENTDQLWATKKEAIEQLGFFLQSDAYQKYAKCEEAIELFYELDDDGLVDTSHYDTALCQVDNVRHHWDDELAIGDVENVIEYFKTLKQIIKLERKAKKLVVFG